MERRKGEKEGAWRLGGSREELEGFGVSLGVYGYSGSLCLCLCVCLLVWGRQFDASDSLGRFEIFPTYRTVWCDWRGYECAERK